jgi:hypothetical protein
MQVQRKTPINENGERVGEDTFHFVRDHWSEYLTFLIDPDFIAADLPVPSGYFVTRHLKFTLPDGTKSGLGFEYWVAPLSFFVWIYYKLS